ncbi:MAG: hypothetical protein K6G27_15575 [Lachnospiraceae bacterium]|nr:hypothetical protein [Lachnospiraceae bacterium]
MRIKIVIISAEDIAGKANMEHMRTKQRLQIFLQRSQPNRPIHIGNRVWIGSGAVITKGVTIGNGAVIAAGGNEFVSVKLTPDELEKASDAVGWCDVCKGWEEDAQ